MRKLIWQTHTIFPGHVFSKIVPGVAYGPRNSEFRPDLSYWNAEKSENKGKIDKIFHSKTFSDHFGDNFFFSIFHRMSNQSAQIFRVSGLFGVRSGVFLPNSSPQTFARRRFSEESTVTPYEFFSHIYSSMIVPLQPRFWGPSAVIT